MPIFLEMMGRQLSAMSLFSVLNMGLMLMVPLLSLARITT
ncbi:putative membrane protein [Synechococcus sp. RS9902]|nr:putative membrane protein [Synechococcus sp. RS9902]